MIKIIITKNIFYFICIILILFTLNHNVLNAYPAGWSDDILLTPADSEARVYPDLDVDANNNIWVVWDTANWPNGVAEILFTKRDSMGNCLIPESTVSNNVTYSMDPDIAIDNNIIQIVWLDETPEGFGIWHTRLAENGSSIVPPHIAVSGSNDLAPFRMVIDKFRQINIIWNELVSSHYQMNYSKLDSMGNPIISKMRVSLPNINAFWGGIGVDSFGNVHLAYRSDSGTSDRLTYTKLDRLSNFLINNKFIGYGVSPTIIADHSQNIHIVYYGINPNSQIRYGKINQNGDVVIGPKNISLNATNDAPHMAMDSLQFLHVVWGDCGSLDSCGIFYTKLDTLGNYVISPEKIVYRPYCYYPWHARIAVDLSNKLNIAWSDQRLYPEESSHIFYKRGENDQSIEEKGIKQPITSNLSCSSNPFTSYTRIPGYEKEDFNLSDVTGRYIGSYKGAKIGENLPAGVYFIISQDKSLKPLRIVKIK